MRTRNLIPLLLALAGCASDPSPTVDSSGGVNTGLNSLMNQNQGEPRLLATAPTPGKPSEVERLADDRVDVQAILDAAAPKTEPPVTVEPAPAAPIAEAEPPKAEPATPEPEQAPAPPKPLAERIDETSLLLIDLLRQDVASSETPFRSAMALAAMEAVRPGSAPKVITPDSTDGGPLKDDQRTLITAFRDLVAGLNAAAQDKSVTPDALTARVVELADTLISTRPMRINAALAAKVTGFGQYMTLGNGKFQQGKPIRAIIYTEVSRFAQRPIKEGDTSRLTAAAHPGDRWAVELSQELQLIHDSDGVKAWQRPEQPIIETSRNARRDFYLVQDITLPTTLSIGAYKLKVIVRDRTSGQEDEAIIPLEVVADPALVSGSAGSLYD